MWARTYAVEDAAGHGEDDSMSTPAPPSGVLGEVGDHAGSSSRGPAFHVCFHGIGTPTHEREPGEALYWVTEDRFRAMLDWLAEVPRVAISFDDGNRSDVEVALPALSERELVASFFPVVGRLGDPWSLSPRGLEELVASGMDVGSHGLNHLPWAGLRGPTARAEIVHPRHALEDLLGRRVDRVAAPLGRYDRRTLALLRASGCAEVNVSDQRPARPGAWVQPRFSVRADDTVASLRARMLASLDPARRVRNSVVSAAKRWT
jgi:peptidoglycan/xylan/chitin deacetylase (PgdA/CDA1 family)